MTHAELNPGFNDDASMMEFKSHGPAALYGHQDWHGSVDYILKRLGLALLVLWAMWATWQYAILYTGNSQLSAALAQQQAQQAVDQLQGQIKQLKSGKP